MAAKATNPELLTYEQAAAYLSTTPRHVECLVAARRLAYVKVGRLTRFHPADLDDFLAANRHAPATELPARRRRTA